MTDHSRAPAEPPDQAVADAKPSHPDEAKSGRNDIVVATMHHGLKRMIFERDARVRTRDGTALCINGFQPLLDDAGEREHPFLDDYGQARPAVTPFTAANATTRTCWCR